jgi:DNA-binding Xre family transcriptional regulator
VGWSKGSGSGDGLRQEQVAYEVSRLGREVTSAITFHLREHGISRTELAARMGLSPGRISQILSGDENLTLQTLATVCAALGVRFHLELQPAEPAQSAQPGRRRSAANPIGSTAVAASGRRRAS